MRSDLDYWLSLLRAPGVGPALFRSLLERCSDLSELFQPAAGRRFGELPHALLDYLRHPDREGVERDRAWLAQPGNHALTLRDPDYPQLLHQLPDPPPILFVVGDRTCLATPQLAVVGSRNPSHAGRQTAHDFAQHLARAGLTITSGLALGVDAAAHRGALAGHGVTIAVAGSGLDRVYPSQHHALAHEITAHGGALVSELPPGTPPLPQHFPRRNRIISGMSLGTLVVEAALHSGSLITARHAAEQGREVFAIPGSIHNPLARGCHALIRQGAKLVETAQDVLEELGPLAHVSRAAEEAPPAVQASDRTKDPDYTRLLECLGHEAATVDEIVRRSGLTAESVSSMLLILELEGIVVTTAGGRYARTTPRG